jgi:hypothetical protein
MNFISRIKKWLTPKPELPHLPEGIYNQVLIDAAEELHNRHTCDSYEALANGDFAEYLGLTHDRIIEKRKELYGSLIEDR